MHLKKVDEKRGRKFVGSGSFADKIALVYGPKDDLTVIRYRDIASYCDAEFFELLACWQTSKALGSPNGGVGWMNEPVEFIEAFLLLESESNKYEMEEMQKKQKDMKTSSKKSTPRMRRRR